MVRFATTNPELAKYVRRLQLRVPSVIFPKDLWGSPYHSLHICQALEDWNVAVDVGGFVIGPPERLGATAMILEAGETLWDRSWNIGHTLGLLSNLVHLENAMSPYYRKSLTVTGASCTGKKQINRPDLYQECAQHRALVWLKGVHEMVSHMTERITSLKVHEVVAIDLYTFFKFPKNLQHLDLNLQLLWTLDEDRFPAFEKTIIEAWRKTLKTLTQLKSLRLAFECKPLFPGSSPFVVTFYPILVPKNCSLFEFLSQILSIARIFFQTRCPC